MTKFYQIAINNSMRMDLAYTKLLKDDIIKYLEFV